MLLLDLLRKEFQLEAEIMNWSQRKARLLEDLKTVAIKKKFITV